MGRPYESSVTLEVAVRLALLVAFVVTDVADPFIRVIHKDEVYLYSNPHTNSYFPTSLLWQMVVVIPVLTIVLTFLFTNDLADVGVASLTVSLLLPLNGFVTNCIKLAVGRPRPDFMHRCWPDGNFNMEAFSNTLNQSLDCVGERSDVMQGRKSFPSGHSSFAFATFGFVFFYLSAKMKTFVHSNKVYFQSYRLVISLLILLVPTCIAISRTCDYHHHWQDVTVGSILGFLLSWVTYRFYYPSLLSHNCDKSYIKMSRLMTWKKVGATPIDLEASPSFEPGDMKKGYSR